VAEWSNARAWKAREPQGSGGSNPSLSASLRSTSYGWQVIRRKTKAARRSLGGHFTYETVMHYVYLVKSVNDHDRHYVGQTNDLKNRLAEHSAGKSIHTQRYKPWNLVCYLGIAGETKAIAFEKHLQSGSGKAFLRRHLL
jgi:putative endonuclease